MFHAMTTHARRPSSSARVQVGFVARRRSSSSIPWVFSRARRRGSPRRRPRVFYPSSRVVVVLSRARVSRCGVDVDDAIGCARAYPVVLFTHTPTRAHSIPSSPTCRRRDRGSASCSRARETRVVERRHPPSSPRARLPVNARAPCGTSRFASSPCEKAAATRWTPPSTRTPSDVDDTPRSTKKPRQVESEERASREAERTRGGAGDGRLSTQRLRDASCSTSGDERRRAKISRI